MESLSPVSPSVVLPPSNSLQLQRPRRLAISRAVHGGFRPRRAPRFLIPHSPEPRRRIFPEFCRGSRGNVGGEEDDGSDEVERAMRLDGSIPGTSDEFVKRVSSRAYDMRRHLHQSFETSSYDVLEANPWRDTSKPVYVLTHGENQLCTMKTRRDRSEVEKELGLLFSKAGKLSSSSGSQPKQSRSRTKFQMVVEDIRDGVLVFEDENEAAKYCDLLQGRGPGCEGVAEIDASSVFDLCRKMRALAVLFRRGRTPPLPQSLELNLKARKRSLED
ncbi:uncharacterized protein LOC115755646 [Rhodamnia argentea]|uniref:Uncharacterized protein LOC115755646 n=1 Tax=Rhodamnia argentea TaxID=178133 RepID=A0A8B8QXD7_9MYRT|nr:uncharacterized protein LOC115755646 [Rhodamnia argentea]